MAARPQQAYRLFFPAAAIHAAVVVPLSVLVMTTSLSWPSGFIGPGHGFEMFFGFALAVVAGYTLGPVSRNLLLALFSLWLAARLAQWVAPFSVLALVLSAAFALALGWQVIPRFLAAKKWRNRIMLPLLGALCLLPLAYGLAWLTGYPDLVRLMLMEAVVLFGLLMAFMGGRVIAPAVAGEFDRQKLKLEARVQPGVEAGFILLLVLAALLLPISALTLPAGMAASAAGLLLLIRLSRWRLWHCSSRPDLLGLALGYFWLAVGFVALGGAIILQTAPQAVLHIITVGAMGTLTTGVMVRIHFQRNRRTPPPTALVVFMVILLALALLARLGAAAAPLEFHRILLWCSALFWAGAFAGLAAVLTGIFNISGETGRYHAAEAINR